MNRNDIKKTLNSLTQEVESITNEKVKSTQKILLNLVEALVEQVDVLREENQILRDEINHLKGEQGKPKFRKQMKDDDGSSDHSSEKNRKNKNKKKSSKTKKNKIRIDRQVICEVDMSTLPDDAVCKGYEHVTIQDIVIHTDNIEFKKETYYSASLKKTFTAKLPEGYHGEFGPGIRALILTLYNDSNMTQPAIERFFKTFNIHISKATISRLLMDNHERFHEEKSEIVASGLRSTSYQHIDDTGGRVNGKNHYVHVLCNPYYTAFFTLPSKDRLTIINLLSQGDMHYCFNEQSYLLMKEMGLSEKYLDHVKGQAMSVTLSQADIEQILKKLFPDPHKHYKNRRTILDASAIVAYQQKGDAILQLIADDAPQFKKITEDLGLCWIHDGRHYKKLTPIIYVHQALTDSFIEDFWGYYRQLQTYKINPTAVDAERLSDEFDNLFSRKTGYNKLDDRIAKSLAKKDELLLVLKFPHIPLHNNPAELGARHQARKRDINLQTINDKGTQAKDTFATIVQTARKLKVNLYDYFYDRIKGKYAMPSLAKLIDGL